MCVDEGASERSDIQRGYEKDPLRPLTWSEWLEGGFDIIPAEEIERRMNLTRDDYYYSKIAENTTVLGIWDDNDYGVNDGQETNPIKHE